MNKKLLFSKVRMNGHLQVHYYMSRMKVTSSVPIVAIGYFLRPINTTLGQAGQVLIDLFLGA